MNCPFARFGHIHCGAASECERDDQHHHHITPNKFETVSPGTGESCWNSHFGKGKSR